MTVSVQTTVNAALSAAGLGSALTSTGASYALTANSAGDGLAHLITIKNNSSNSHAGKTMTIVGTDEQDRALSQTITGPAGTSTVTSTSYFKTVTSVTPSASTGADTFNIGWTASSVSPWIPTNLRSALPVNIAIGSNVVSGSPNYTLQYSYDKSSWFTHSTITGKTSSFDGTITFPVRALRFVYTVAGSVTHTVIDHDGMGG